MWSVALPEGAEPPFQVWVNGEPKEEGPDYRVEGRWLRFATPLRPKVRHKGVGRRMMLLAGIGVFVGASAACGAAPNLESLVAFRVHVGLVCLLE